MAMLEIFTLPEGFGSSANAANATKEPNAISHVANDFFEAAMLPLTGNPLCCSSVRTLPVELSDIRRR
jgi:hypothetical protein